jgi:ubiquinone/menaquinone biosynthesis C-methylase UbiE
MSESKDYLLGVNQFELDRLRFQHSVWKEVTDTFFDRLKIQKGWKILDAGSGPGFVTMDLLERTGKNGELTALEPSEMYLNYFKNYCSKKNINNVKFISGTVETSPDLPENYYNLIFARWVIGFVPDPDLFIAKLSKSLAPGGIIAFEDYAFHGLYLYPRSGNYEKVSPAALEYWQLTGGDLCIAPRIPAIFKKYGLELVEFKPNSIAGSPGSGIFQWHHYFLTHHVPLMAEKGIITKETADEILADWDTHCSNPDSIFFSPLVVDVAGKIMK